MITSDARQGEQSNQIVTMGKLFPDGSAIDQLRAGQLLHWHDGYGEIGSTAIYGAQTYAPATLDAHLEQVLHLPAETQDFGRAADLIMDLREEVLRACPGLDEDASLLSAIGGMVATWVPECVPGPLLINPWGPPGTETALLDLMGCVCRRPLRLAEPSLHELASLPAGLTPTLILVRPSERALRRLVAAAGEPDTYFLSGGEVVQLHCPIIVSTCKPVNLPALKIRLPRATHALRRITKPEAQNLADRFQPRLLRYRLMQHLSVANSQFDVPGFCPEARLIARVLGAVVEGSPGLQTRIADALRSMDEQCKAEESQGLAAVVLETLLMLSHSKMPVAYVGQITELANTLLENRDENIQLSPRAVGETLRQELGRLLGAGPKVMRWRWI